MAIEHDPLLNTDIIVEDTIKDQYLTFEIDGEDYGIEISSVKEIIKMQAITRVPDMPYFIEGVTNLRGDLIGVLDVRKRFGKPPKEYDEATCIIVIMYMDYLLGLIVDSVKETATIPETNITPPPSAKLSAVNHFIRAIGTVGDSIKLLLDLERFLVQD
ncbi:MAG: chemotaxis protein CheW [Clostridiales bacterium]|jgi:purine-binding chemotaxis protein CheW|nr:chemotaxis protein CheW [Clostridiales bacterium]